MLIVISPAKTLDMQKSQIVTHTTPQYLKQSAQLVEILRTLDAGALGRLMDISPDLAQLNVQRFADWRPRMSGPHAKQALLAFAGDVYDGLDAASLDADTLAYAQDHLRILSGLYGLLRPLDMMRAYRLEMGTRLANPQGRDLYAFWGETQTAALNAQARACGAQVLLNLASEEYFRAVKPKLLQLPVVTPVFEDYKNGKYKVISFFAKRARGAMARHVLQQRIRDPRQLESAAVDGYRFVPEESDASRLLFRRRLAD